MLAMLLGVGPGFAGASTPASYLETRAPSAYDLTPQGFTVECWIRVRSTPGFDPRIIRAVNSESGPCGYEKASVWDLSFCHLSDCPPGSLTWSIQASGACRAVFSSGRVDDGQFHHIACTYDGIHLRIYLDGLLQGELEAPGSYARVGGGKLVVGNSSDYGNPFDGEIDELRIWSSARTESEIQKWMAAEIHKLPPHLVAYWPMNGNCQDLTASGNHLEPHNYIAFPAGRIGRAAAVMNVDVLRGGLPNPGETRDR